MARCFLLLGFLVAATPALFADVGVPASSNFDSDFARAAELLENGRRSEAQAVLAEIRASAGGPAWQARAAMLLAADEERRKDPSAALEQLSGAPAASIGLEPYRRWRLGRILAVLGRWPEAGVELRAAFETDESFAMRRAAGRDWASALCRQGRAAEAARVLARIAPGASGAEAGAVGAERIRLALASGDAATVRSAAKDMVAAGVDASGAIPAFARQPVAAEIARLAPAERARFARLRMAADDVERAVRLLKSDRPALWPPQERAGNLLALARGQRRLGYSRAAEATLAKVPQDGSPSALEAKLLQIDLSLEKVRRQFPSGIAPGNAALSAAQGSLQKLAEPSNPPLIRAQARQRLVRILAEGGLFEEGFSLAMRAAAEDPEGNVGFEPLWKLAWQSYLAADWHEADRRLGRLLSLTPSIPFRRRLTYWRARCLEWRGQSSEAAVLFQSLAESVPADIYALFARPRVPDFQKCSPALVSDPARATAAFRRADELLRLRFFAEAAAEAQSLPPSRGRDLRLAQADFALGRFSAAVVFAKRAFPEMGTAAEGSVPDGWRRLYYPVEEGGYLAARARESGLDPAILRALVRQESVFDASARSRAGALGLMQLMPKTAKSLTRPVLRRGYRRSFLYDPGINARLGAAYLKDLLEQFHGRALYALAAYNGGPARMERLLKENPGRSEDEIFESHPAPETRDYVRRVLLYAESYRELYP